MPRTGPVVLLGLMATGKTTIGRIVAEALGRDLLDSDQQILEATGRTVGQLIEEGGPDAHRPAEADALHDAVARPVPAVVSAAAGVVLDPGSLALLRELDGTVAWLRARPETILPRLVAGADRHDHRPPLPTDDRIGWLRGVVRDRTPLYEAVADVVVDVDDLAPEVAAERIIAVVRGEAA